MDAAKPEQAAKNLANKFKHKRAGSNGCAGLLQTLENSLGDIRTLITCRVCVRPLFEPYTIECGHTFCYGCLVRWFERDRTKKTCPDCRADVIRPPAPAYLIRDMTQIFASRAELMPVGETTEEHKQWQEDEAALVEKDRSSDGTKGGLFRGCFRTWSRNSVVRVAPIRDDEDSVDRCPRCTWELEDGLCGSCGYPEGESGSSVSDGDEYYHPDELYDMEDGIDMDDDLLEALADEARVHGHGLTYAEENDSTVDDYYSPPPPIRRRVLNILHPNHPTGNVDILPDREADSEDEGEEFDSLDGFVVTDEEDRLHSNTSSDESIPPSLRSSPRSMRLDTEDGTSVEDIQHSDEDEDSQHDSESNEHEASSSTSHYGVGDESDEGPVPPSRRQMARISFDSDDSASSDSTQAVPAIRSRAQQRRSPGNAVSAPRHQINIPHHSRATRPSNGGSGVIEIESDSEPPVTIQRHRRRRPVQNRLSSDDETSSEASSGTATVGRQSPRPRPRNRRINRIQGSQTSTITSPIVLESSPTSSASAENEDTRRPAVPGALSTSMPRCERSQSALPAISAHSPPESYERTRQPIINANHGAHSSPRNLPTLDHPAYPEQPSPSWQRHRNRLHSPSRVRRGRNSPTIRLSRSPIGSEGRSAQTARDRRAQKLEKRAERERIKAEREQTSSARAVPASIVQ